MTKFPNLYLCHSWHARWLLKFTSQGLNLEVLSQDSQDASLNTIRPWNLTTKFPNLYLCHSWHARWLPKSCEIPVWMQWWLWCCGIPPTTPLLQSLIQLGLLPPALWFLAPTGCMELAPLDCWCLVLFSVTYGHLWNYTKIPGNNPV